MIAGPAAFKSSRVATTDDFICIPNGNNAGVISTSNTILGSNAVGASLASSIAHIPTIIPPVVTLPPIAHPLPTVIGAGLPLGSTINNPIIPSLQSLPPVSITPIMPVSTYKTSVMPPPAYTETYGGIPINSSRLLIEQPCPTPIGQIGGIGGSVLRGSRAAVVPTCCPECACCYGLGGCCSFNTPMCGCGPAGCYPNCCPPCGLACNPACCAMCGPACFDQCCFGICPCNTNCFGCRCFC